MSEKPPLTCKQILKQSPYVEGLNANTDLPKFRAVVLARKRELTAANPSAGEVSYVEEDRQIPVRDGSSIAVRIHKPKSPPQDGCPIFVIYHGGGFVLGSLETETLLCRKFTELGGIAVNVDYRLAPEHPFPTPCHDAYDALKWVRLHGPHTNKIWLIRIDCGAFRGAWWEPEEGILGWRY